MNTDQLPDASEETHGSSSPRVALDYFDPQGVNSIRRTLTIQSANGLPETGLGPLPEGLALLAKELEDVSNFDLRKHLQMVVLRERENSISPRELGVVFQDLRVEGLGSSASLQPTFGSTLNPFLIPQKLRQAMHPRVRDLISGFEGVVRPGEMLLVLGRPGAGCTTLLKTLSNQHEDFHKVSGLLNFGHFTPRQIHRHYRGDVIYCPEDDVHFPTLTVQQTLEFAARTRAPGKDARFQGLTRDQYVTAVTGILGTVFGLRHVKDTKVGNAAIRGVSGGERKRVSIAEALAIRAKLQAWDNSTRGLDASTALEFVRAIRIGVDVMKVTSIVAIYQASELLYELFDKVCVISEGKMVFFGPAQAARQYFYDMGYEPANRQTTADFLVAITDANGRTPRNGFEKIVPRSTDEMVDYFQRSKFAQRNKAEIAAYLAENIIDPPSTLLPTTTATSDGATLHAPHVSKEEKEKKALAYKESARAEQTRHRLVGGSPYTISIVMQVREVIRRRIQILHGDWLTQAINFGVYVYQAIIMGTVFLRAPVATSAYFSRGGVLFFALLFGTLSSMSEIPALFAQRPIVFRHSKAAMYHPFVESLALTIVDIPITFITVLLFSVILYFLVKLQQTASQFFIFFLFIFVVTLAMKAFFRALSATFRRSASAQALAGVCVLILSLYTGYSIPQPTMIGALRWLTYINPLRYGFEAVLSNEFHTINGTCSTLVPQGPMYANVSLANMVCTTVGSVPGVSAVDGNRYLLLSFGYEYGHLWRNFGIVVAFTIGFMIAFNLISEIKSSSTADDARIPLFKRDATNATVPEGGEVTDVEKGKPFQAPGVRRQKTRETIALHADKALRSQEPMTDVFTWRHINYTISVSGRETRQLLDDVWGYVVPGKLTALMGESGAGKTTLLNVLAERTEIGVITGDRLVNGHALPRDFKAQTGYCQQLDVHLAEATVREALLFSACLRQPASVPLAEKKDYVETCLEMCGLDGYGDAIVGSLGVEHRKRTTIAVELAAKPKLLLFLDEPTSGLDSQSAWAIVEFLRKLADHGQAILCTIHQPSGELFQMFDRLLLLRKGGQTVYFGDLGLNASTLISYFERNGARKCGEDENPAEWMLDVIGAGATASSTVEWYDTWVKSPEAAVVQGEIEVYYEEGLKHPPVQATRKSEFATSWLFQLYFLTMRTFRSYWRSPTYLMSKFMLNIAAGLLIGFTFFKSKETLQGTQNKIFATFMATILSVPLSAQLQAVFIEHRNVYEIRERPSQTYSWSALLTALLLTELPFNIAGSSLFFFCWYWTVGFATSRAGYSYLLYGVTFPFYYTTIAQAVASVSPDPAVANILFSALYSFVIIFNGVLQPYAQLNWWKWMYRVTPFTYLIEGLVGQVLGGQEISCAPHEFVSLNPPAGDTCASYMEPFLSYAGGYLQNPEAKSDCLFCSAKTTDQFLNRLFSIYRSHDWRDFGIFVGVSIFNIGALFAMMFLFRIHRKAISRETRFFVGRVAHKIIRQNGKST